MPSNSIALSTLADLEAALTSHGHTPRRVQLKVVLPLVDRLMKEGFPIAYLADVLEQGGMPFKPASLKQAMYLWRKRQAAQPPSTERNVEKQSAQRSAPGAFSEAGQVQARGAQ